MCTLRGVWIRLSLNSCRLCLLLHASNASRSVVYGYAGGFLPAMKVCACVQQVYEDLWTHNRRLTFRQNGIRIRYNL